MKWNRVEHSLGAESCLAALNESFNLAHEVWSVAWLARLGRLADGVRHLVQQGIANQILGRALRQVLRENHLTKFVGADAA